MFSLKDATVPFNTTTLEVLRYFQCCPFCIQIMKIIEWEKGEHFCTSFTLELTLLNPFELSRKGQDIDEGIATTSYYRYWANVLYKRQISLGFGCFLSVLILTFPPPAIRVHPKSSLQTLVKVTTHIRLCDYAYLAFETFSIMIEGYPIEG